MRARENPRGQYTACTHHYDVPKSSAHKCSFQCRAQARTCDSAACSRAPCRVRSRTHDPLAFLVSAPAALSRVCPRAPRCRIACQRIAISRNTPFACPAAPRRPTRLPSASPSPAPPPCGAPRARAAAIAVIERLSRPCPAAGFRHGRRRCRRKQRRH